MTTGVKTIALEVIAAATVPEAVPEPVADEPPAAGDAPAEVVVIHVAPGPRLDPSTDLDKVEIVDDDELAGFAAHVRRFIVE